jgi:hypothetical protein
VARRISVAQVNTARISTAMFITTSGGRALA